MTKKYIGCSSWICQQCVHYAPYLSVSTMHDICRNNGNVLQLKYGVIFEKIVEEEYNDYT